MPSSETSMVAYCGAAIYNWLERLEGTIVAVEGDTALGTAGCFLIRIFTGGGRETLSRNENRGDRVGG
jgi:hypothetical protein